MLEDTLADTIRVRTRDPGLWESNRTLVPELAIGIEGGPPDAALGDPAYAAMLPGGAIAILDVLVPQVRVFGAEGMFLRAVGCRGPGPGEYRIPTGLAALPNGDLTIHDAADNVITVFDSSGGVRSSWSRAGMRGLLNSLAADGDSVVTYRFGVRGASDPPFSSPRIGIAWFTTNGVLLDSLVAPTTDAPDLLLWPFYPKRVAVWNPAGFLVTANTGEYRLGLWAEGRPVIQVVRNVPPVLLAEEEWEIWDEIHRFMERRQGVDLPDVPRVKPPIKDVLVARTGEIWVQRHSGGVRIGPRPPDIIAAGGDAAVPWVEPSTLDVFDRLGRLLGTIETRRQLKLLAASSDTVWARTPGTVGEPIVVRFRVATDGAVVSGN